MNHKTKETFHFFQSRTFRLHCQTLLTPVLGATKYPRVQFTYSKIDVREKKRDWVFPKFLQNPDAIGKIHVVKFQCSWERDVTVLHVLMHCWKWMQGKITLGRLHQGEQYTSTFDKAGAITVPNLSALFFSLSTSGAYKVKRSPYIRKVLIYSFVTRYQ